MCLPRPSIPTPDPVQEAKTPDAASLAASAKKNRQGGLTGGSLLTGPSGVANAATGKNTLLGG